MHPRVVAGVLLIMAVPIVQALPRVVVDRDDVEIRQSCEVWIPQGTVVADTNTNGVLHIVADGVTVRFAPGSELRGAPPSTPWDQLRGIGVVVTDRRRVRLVGAKVHGYFNGVVASRADQLEIDGGDFSDNYRQRLRSTPEAEDGADWLFPHRNDEVKWRDQYGGAVCVESSRRVRVHGIRVRRGQNGIVLDRVEDARIYDNDASFLSGWGLALWRSSRNVVSRNAFDFCVRGHVEGVYNRGQDSAGILAFEQCNDNVFVANSCTHGGDGFFGFAGREALGETWMETERDRLRRETGRQEVEDAIRVPEDFARTWSERGCNSNVFVGNDFSYASAHGFEMTFSEGNVFVANRVVENAICGIWGGYSSRMRVEGNEFMRNGGMAYGLERGAINMEHASGNRMVGNTFLDNRCGIHLWWDRDPALSRLPGVAGNARGVRDNVIAGNRFEVTSQPGMGAPAAREKWVTLQLRDEGSGQVRDTLWVSNQVILSHPLAVEFDLAPGIEVSTAPVDLRWKRPRVRAWGSSQPVGARAFLRGREHIVMDEWGPWDFESPLMRPRKGRSGERRWEILGVEQKPRVTVVAGRVETHLESAGGASWRLRVRVAEGVGVTPFDVRVMAPDLEQRVEGTLVACRWDAVFFPWTRDPREDLAGWRAEARGAGAVHATLDSLDLAYGGGGPKDVVPDPETRARGPGGDRFGMRARTSLVLPQGTWRFRTLSDDGVRVRVDGRTILENWTWHGPTPDEGLYVHPAAGSVEVEVEHFEIDGYAVFSLQIEATDPADGAKD